MDTHIENDKDHGFLIVGIGASAGGIKATQEFLEEVPANSGVAYVVILHLAPDYESHLAEVLQTSSSIPVTQVQETIKIKPDHVYVISPNKSLSMKDGHLSVSEIKGYEERRAPVDIFFRTLATEHTTLAVAVILSGTGPNGSMGVKRVKEMGGIILVQEPREAEYSDMPRNSIETGLVDYVLPVKEIPAKISSYNENRRGVHINLDEAAGPDSEETALRDVFIQLRARTRHDFSNYKRATILRRIERRLNVHDLSSLAPYANFLREHPEEVQALLKDLLISVTNFFRDAEAFHALEQNVIPKLFAGKGSDDHVRVWIPGCATGEEVYSITMLLMDHMTGMMAPPNVQVFASDIDEQAASVARDGFYSDSDVADVPPEHLRRYFIKETEGYRVSRELRETVLFAHHNLIKDPPFSHLDLVSCRNLLIYLNRTAQQRVMQVMHFALNSGGFLFLGGSESIDAAGDLFATLDADAHIYQSRGASSRVMLPLSDLSLNLPADERLRSDRKAERKMVEEKRSYSDLHHRLIEHYGPPSIVINEQYEIIHLSDRAGRYLQFNAGDASLNLLKVIRPELQLELRTALYQAARSHVNVDIQGLAVTFDDQSQMINLMVRPAAGEGDTARGYFLVLFAETSIETGQQEGLSSGSGNTVEPAMAHLEAELARSRAQLRDNLEQYDSQAEEMKASNEELQAMNEELRSSTEELETSKEELQSLNEELHTVNQELKIKIDELSHTNNDFRNLISSTDIATIFLDRSLHIKLFTPRAREIFSLIPADIGRTLGDISSSLTDDTISIDTEKLLHSLQTVEREVATRDGRFFLMRLFPYRTTEHRIEGVVMTFVDITERQREQQEKFFLASIVESSEDSIMTVNFAGEITSWNSAAQTLYGYSAKEAIGKPLSMLMLPQDLQEVLAKAEMVKHSERVEIYDSNRVNKEGQEMNLEVMLSPVKDTAGRVIGVSTVARDVTEKRRADEGLLEQKERLNQAFGIETVGIVFIDMEGTVTQANNAFLRMSGYSREQIDQRSINTTEMTSPEWIERAQTALTELQNYWRITPYEKELRRPDNSRWWGLVAGTRLSETEAVEFVLDLTERKRAEMALLESEERLRLLIETAEDYAIFTMMPDLRVNYWNAGAQRIFAYDEEEILGQSAAILFTPEDRDRNVPELERLTAEVEGKAADERWHIDKFGRRFYASGIMMPLRSGDVLRGFAKIARDLTSQKRAEEELQLAHDALEERVAQRTAELLDLNQALLTEVKERTAAEERARRLMQQIVTTQEDERRRVARDLHDHLGQQLTGLRIKLENHKFVVCADNPLHQTQIEEIQAIAERLDADVDFLSWELRPASLDEFGLTVALENFVQEWSKHFGISAEFHTTGTDHERLAPEIEINLYRIAQEALNNIAKHAEATGVDVLLQRRDPYVELIVEDNGKGFEPDAVSAKDERSIGLLNMRERASFVGGALQIESNKGDGTTVFVRIPTDEPQLSSAAGSKKRRSTD
jgi:two-component system CheB/CheR fusion protein